MELSEKHTTAPNTQDRMRAKTKQGRRPSLKTRVQKHISELVFECSQMQFRSLEIFHIRVTLSATEIINKRDQGY